MDTERPNERRADLGAIAIMAAGTETNVADVEPAETAIRDVLAYVAHLCDRLGLSPRETFDLGLESYWGDYEDGPKAVVLDGFDPYEQRLGEAVGQTSPPIVLCVRDPDYENDYTVVGDVRVISIDLGRGFDGGKGFRALDPDDRQEYVELWRAQVADLPEDHAVRREVELLIESLQGGDE